MELLYMSKIALCIKVKMLILLVLARVYYNKEGGRVSYSSIVPCTAVVRVQARLMIFTLCGVIYGVLVGSRIRVVTQRACQVV